MKKPFPSEFTTTPKGKGVNVSSRIDDAMSAFKASITGLLNDIRVEGISPRRFAEFERTVFEHLGEIGRAAEVAALEACDVQRPSIEVEGKTAYLKYRGPEEYQSFFGKVAIERSVYQANGPRTRAVVPLERNAGIRHHNMTPMAAEFVSHAAALTVPDEVHAMCQRWHLMRPSATTIKDVARDVGALTEHVSELCEPRMREEEREASPAADCVVTSRDGTMVNIRGSGWKQAEVGSVSMYKDGERITTKYCAVMPDGSDEGLDPRLDREVEAATGSHPRAQLVYIADGAPSNWKYQQNHPILRDAVPILDFWHAAQRISQVADALFGENTPEGKSWFAKQRLILRDDVRGVNRVLQSIRNQRTRRRLEAGKRAATVQEVVGYFHRNRERMRYWEYKRRGLPIGSGVVEAGCKVVVGQRMKRSGMRWSARGGQHILNLRTLVLSGRWDAFWSAHTDLLNLVRVAA